MKVKKRRAMGKVWFLGVDHGWRRNSTGYLDSEDDALFDQWEDDEEEKFFRGLEKDDWRAIGQFCLFLLSAFLNEPMKEFRMAQAILGMDGSEGFEGREKLNHEIAVANIELAKYRRADDTAEDKLNELERENKFLKEEIQSKRPGPDDSELRKEFIAYQQSYETVAQCWSMREAALQKDVAELEKKLEVVKKERDSVLERGKECKVLGRVG